jgi:hypothetical protein
MKMHTVNIEEAAYVIFFHPEYEQVVVEDLSQNLFVMDEVKERLQKYSLQYLATDDPHARRCLDEQCAYLHNLLNALKKKGIYYGRA